MDFNFFSITVNIHRSEISQKRRKLTFLKQKNSNVRNIFSMFFQFLESLWPSKFWLHEFYNFFFLRATVPNLRKFKKKGFLVVMSFISTRKISIWTSFWIWNFFLLRCWKRIGGCITMTFIIFCVFTINFRPSHQIYFWN